jgi:hypothetical protein
MMMQQAAPGVDQERNLNYFAFTEGRGSSILSVALLEEIELTIGVLQQLFEHAHIWAEKDS